MAQATNTTLGEIKLAGDLAGSNNALLPELTSTGVAAGSYVFPKVTVDQKGRILSASNSTSSDMLNLIPDASQTVKGLVKVGANIDVTTSSVKGSQTISYNQTLTTSRAHGLATNAAPYTATITTDNGTVNVSVTAANVTSIQDVINSINSQMTIASVGLSSGDIVISSNTLGTASTVALSNDNLFRFIPGFASVGVATAGTGLSTISIPDATSSTKGVVRIGSGLSAVNGVVSVDVNSLPAATVSSKGVVQPGPGIAVNSGVISVTPAVDATASTKGVVQIGSNINVSGGVISIPDATSSTKGAVKVGTGLAAVDGVVSLDPTAYATNGSAGVVKVGAGLSVTNGVLGLNAIASTSTLGLVKVGAGVTVDGTGTISTATGTIPDATTAAKGIVRIGNGLSVTNGVVSVPDATSTTKGVVQIGTGLSVTNGYVAAAHEVATTSTKGVVQIGSGLNVAAGVVSLAPIADASTSTKGLVQVGSGLTVANGVITANGVPDATASTKGLVQVGNGLSVSGGVINALTATSGTYGVVRSANVNNVTITNGLIDVGPSIPKTSGGNVWDSGFCTAPITLTHAASITVNTDQSNMFFHTITSNCTYTAPSGVHPGQVFKIIIKQDATGSRVATFNPVFRFDSNGSTLSTAAGKYDIITVTCIDANTYLARLTKGF